jgi:drug/metabolite transporter (DMT)-like permease
MTIFTLSLILISAVLHATWNLLAKRANGGASLIWLYDTCSVLLYAPVVLIFWLLAHPQLSLMRILFILASSVLQMAYFLLLQRGYRVGDLSVVYPIARGTGPLLSTIIAILIFHERPSLLALLGTVLVVAGVFIIASGKDTFKKKGASTAFMYGALVGVSIAAYTLWDKQAVSTVLVPPLLLYYGTTVIRMLVLAPFALTHRDEVSMHWHEHRLEVFGVAVLNPLSYIIILTALVFSPVSYVAPTREVGVLFGILLGARLLSEGEVKRRLFAATIIVIGIIALAL